MGGGSGPPPRVLAIVGPTACGKSAVAFGVARALGGELVVADPFQRYRGLEIAADSPSPHEREAIAHHGVGDLALTERSDAASFSEIAHRAIDGALARGHVPIVSGGTGLYVRAALADLDFPPEPTAQVRAAADEAVTRDLAGAAAEVARRDPARAHSLDERNPRRVARALALVRSGVAPTTPSRLWSGHTRHPTLIVGLERPREELDRRIAARVERELADGLVDELTRALAVPGLAREPRQIIGMREVAAMRAGDLDPSDLAERLTVRTRRLARKQLTWLRKTPGVTPLDLGDADSASAVARVVALWRVAQRNRG
ncbi:MAG TPA: tRNA (adenosine(37)-N6)-dimethylallyltransferase MiaA [Miltoncostaeaceae bacterium]|nr:tRNA (adenosine(37)-N6)-dimethylallyltransferase MiaA [Miltoncostaeaceae bacterium]